VCEHLTEHYSSDCEATLAEEPGPVQQLLDGLKFVRNRITHEVDEIGCISARAKNPSSFEAHWAWRSLPPRLMLACHADILGATRTSLAPNSGLV